MAQIQVAVRSRPWTREDRLGVDMQQVKPEEGSIELLNSDYSTKFFSFNYSWWTAFNWKHYCDDKDKSYCENMSVVSQDDVYGSVGAKIKKDLYDGNAVVLFAYGLSGSGKTYTVFGTDDVKNKNSWFYHETPHSSWGILPRLAWDIFQDRKDGWKVTMKYFQNVVETVRDLASPQATEKVYKEGMRKDQDGFMDIQWCQSTVLNSWGDLRKAFIAANARKAIAPTQFNPQSTRGHCIMTIEVLMPDEQDPSIKKRGRVYVCDLAGTEPAGDIYFANYETVPMGDGTTEQKLVGPHADQAKTKELRAQGKKINLSLSEMAMFFMKMAELTRAKKLKPGASIPGNNTYFLCKYLKDTMLQAKTYLLCAVRPEAAYLKYTFSTLGFARNASCVRLNPKKATTAASAAERRLMAELEKYKKMVAELRAAASSASPEEVARLQAQLLESQTALQSAVNDGGEEAAARAAEQKKKEEQYRQRGITLFENVSPDQLDAPYLVNIDEDEFRSRRFLYALREGSTAFGADGDCRPPSFSVVAGHCRIEREGLACTLVGGQGKTWVAGRQVDAGDRVRLEWGNWVKMGKECLMYHGPGHACTVETDLTEVFRDVNKCAKLQEAAEKVTRPGMMNVLNRLREQSAEIADAETAQSPHKNAAKTVASFDEHEVLRVLQLIKDAREVCCAFDRSVLKFEVVLSRVANSEGEHGRVLVSVLHESTKQVCYLNESEFTRTLQMLQDEKLQVVMALEAHEAYTVPDAHDPVALFFDHTFHYASGTHLCEYVGYGFDTEDEDKDVRLNASASPYHDCGVLNVEWVPAMENFADQPDVEDLSQLLGRPWQFKLRIKNAALKVRASQSYVSYVFPNESGDLERFATDVCGLPTMTPEFHYEHVHYIPKVTQAFLDFISGDGNGMDFDVYASATYALPEAKISTANSVVSSALGRGPAAPSEDYRAAFDRAVAELSKATGEEPSLLKQRLLEARARDAAVS